MRRSGTTREPWNVSRRAENLEEVIRDTVIGRFYKVKDPHVSMGILYLHRRYCCRGVRCQAFTYSRV